MKKTIVGFLIVLAAACASDESGKLPSADEQFTELSLYCLKGLLAFKPVYSSRLGEHSFDAELPDYSPRSVEAECLRIDGFLQQLSTIAAGRLSSRNLDDLEILCNSLEAWKCELTSKPAFKRDPLFYNKIVVEGIELLLRRDHAPAAERMKSLVSRLERIPEFFEVARINLTEVPELLRKAAENPLINSMYLLRDSLPERILAQMDGLLPEGFEGAHIKAIYAYTDFIFFVNDRLKEMSIENNGLGDELFKERWALKESMEINLEDVLDLCAGERERLLSMMAENAGLIDPETDTAGAIRRMENNHESVKWISDEFARIAEKLKEFTCEKNIVSTPAGGFGELKVIPAEPRTTSYITTIPPEIMGFSSRAGLLAINPLLPGCTHEEKKVLLRFFYPSNIAMLAAGAGYPGKFVAASMTRENDSLLRKVLESATFTEGWASYSVKLMIELGFDPRPETLLTQLRMCLLETNRMEISARIHCKGMKIEDAVKFMEENSFISPLQARREVIGIVRNPMTGAGLIGKKIIMKLRDEYLSEDSSRTRRGFHDLLLSEGKLPLPVIAQIAFMKKI